MSSYPPPTRAEFRGLQEMVMHHERTLYGEEDEGKVVRKGAMELLRETHGQVGELVTLSTAKLEQEEAQGRWSRVWLMLVGWMAFIQLGTLIAVIVLVVRSCSGEQ